MLLLIYSSQSTLLQGMTELAGFATWFHKVREDFARVNFGTSGVVCPDSMTTIHDDIQMDKKYWIGLACRLNVCKIPHCSVSHRIFYFSLSIW